MKYWCECCGEWRYDSEILWGLLDRDPTPEPYCRTCVEEDEDE